MIDFNCIFTENIECSARKTLQLSTDKMQWYTNATNKNIPEAFTYAICRICPKLNRDRLP